MSELLIKCASTGSSLRLSEYHATDPDPWARTRFQAELCSDGLSARCDVADVNGTPWPAFFEDLAAHWRGWQGEKSMGSSEGHILLEARSDTRGHVSLVVTLAKGADDEGWQAGCTLELEAGQLDALATRASRFFDGDA